MYIAALAAIPVGTTCGGSRSAFWPLGRVTPATPRALSALPPTLSLVDAAGSTRIHSKMMRQSYNISADVVRLSCDRRTTSMQS